MAHLRPLLPFAAVAALACSESAFFVPGDKEPPPPEPASLQGRVCDLSGRTWLSDALVYTHLFTADGNLYETRQAYSDQDGYWYLDGLPPEQDYTIYVQFGDDIIETHEVFLNDGEFRALEEPDCFDPLQLDVAVVTGDYDNFDLVLESLGFANYQLIDGLAETEIRDFLSDLDAMRQFDIIFLNGGHVEENILYDLDDADAGSTPALILENLREYVRGGGSLYASDWAYDAIELAWPDRIEFVGDDAIPDSAQHGEYAIVQANVADAALADWLGEPQLDIEYDLPVWPPIESVNEATTTHLTATVTYRIGTDSYNLSNVPILVSFGSGEGRVAYSTFRVAKNGDAEMLSVLQYMMYNL